MSKVNDKLKALMAAVGNIEKQFGKGVIMRLSGDEPLQPDNRFIALPNVLLSPHLGGATRDVVRHQMRPTKRPGSTQWTTCTRTCHTSITKKPMLL